LALHGFAVRTPHPTPLQAEIRENQLAGSISLPVAKFLEKKG
jgi:hypothetical protein